MKGIVCEKGINDMPYGWTRENEWNKIVYDKWHNMLYRVYNNKDTSYINSTIELEWHWLSKFVDDFKKIDGYNDEKLLNGELELDKDIKSNGKNKKYSLENCMLVSKLENHKQVTKTMDYSYMQGEKHWNYGNGCLITGDKNPFYGKKHSEETKRKIGQREYKKGKDNPKSKKVCQYDLNDNLIKTWDSITEASNFYNIKPCNIIECCKGTQKTSKGFKWRYYKEEDK